MSKHNIHEVKEVFEQLIRRHATLPEKYRNVRCGLNVFQREIERFEEARQHAKSNDDTALRVSQMRVDGCVRLARHCLNQAKKKPLPAFENFNVGALVLERELDNDHQPEAVEKTIQQSIRRSHTYIQAATTDKKHWLRNTPTFELIS